MQGVIRPFDHDAVRDQYRTASPFPFFSIDNFLEPDFAEAVFAAYPSYESARKMGKEFAGVNERLKIDITDRNKFPHPVTRLAEALNGEAFLSQLRHITDIQGLLPDWEFRGGGMHMTSSSGLLDVHVDFNYVEDLQYFRRLNILVYLNKVWDDSWGGKIELWDKDVSRCHHSFAPIFNRCVVFETSEISYHGVTQVKCPPGQVRKSFAAYYYTREPPPHWDGTSHSTIFRSRPDEKLKGTILMPAERLQRWLVSGARNVKKSIRSVFR